MCFKEEQEDKSSKEYINTIQIIQYIDDLLIRILPEMENNYIESENDEPEDTKTIDK